MTRALFVLTATVATAALAIAAAREARTPPPSILLVTIDTVRADRLTPYGLADASMPNLERLAREGVVFDQAGTVAPLTLPAHASLMTGLLPPVHGVRDNADAPLAARHTTLAERYAAKGYRTGAFVGSVVLDPERGLAQGFEVYESVDPHAVPRQQRRGDAVVSSALRWLDGAAAQRFFLWTHLYDAHAPYDAPPPYRDAHLDPYVAELLFVDAQIGRLLAALDRLGLAANTYVIVVGDHGEGLGDHGENTHGFGLFESVLHVPLIVRGPGLRPGRVAEVVRLVDIAPTVLSLTGIPSEKVDGAPFVRALRGVRIADAEVYAETMYPARLGRPGVRSLRADRYKLIDDGTVALFDLWRDPFELQNIASDRTAVVSAMRARLEAISPPSTEFTSGPLDLPPGLREQLAALGYVGRSPTSDR